MTTENDPDFDIDADLDEKIERSLDVLAETWDRFDSPVLTCSFGKDSNTVAHLAHRSTANLGTRASLAFLDHGNHFEETWAVKEAFENRFDLAFETYEPESSYEALVEEYGPLVNQRKPSLCCSTLKSRPMERMIDGHDGWITGYRVDEGRGDDGESYDWRKDLQFFEQKDEVVRINPIVHWTAEDVWDYHERHDLPYNDLYDADFDCLGCKQCTLDGDALFAYDSLRQVGDDAAAVDD